MINEQTSVKLYQSFADSDKRRKMERWHASSLSQCLRSQYLSRQGVEPTGNIPSSAKLLRFKAGHLMEEVIRPHVGKLFTNVTPNMRVTSEKLDLTGEMDNLALEEGTIIEIKTVHDYAFKEKDGVTGLKEQIGVHKNGNKAWGIKQDPYLHHQIQNHAYVLLLAEQGVVIEKIQYVYMSLSGRIVVYDTEVQDDLLDNVRGRLDKLNRAWEDRVPPECVCMKDGEYNEQHPLWGGVLQFCDYQTENGCCEIKEEKNG